MNCHDLVTIKDLQVTLGGNPILRGVSASICHGQITALIGLNGSGKTTLLRSVLKEVPYAGTIEFHCGHDHSKPLPQHVGYVPQKLRIDANLPLTVRDLLALALQRRPLFLGISRRTHGIMAAALQRVHASSELLDRPVDKLSGGELQRVLLALALQPEPELLLLDEPAAGIDFQHEEKFYELIAELNRRTGVTILLVSHELSVVSTYAHHVLCLKDGRIHCQGPPGEIMNQEMLAATFGAEKSVYEHSHHRHRHAPEPACAEPAVPVIIPESKGSPAKTNDEPVRRCRMSMLLRRCLQRSSLVEQLVENWQFDHEEAMFASDVEELSSECYELAELCDRSWRILVDRLFDGKIENFETTGQAFRTAVRRTVDVLTRVNMLVRKAESKGHKVGEAAKLKEGLELVQAVESKLDSKWPFFDPAVIEESRVAIERGEYCTAEDLLNEIQGADSGARQHAPRAVAS